MNLTYTELARYRAKVHVKGPRACWPWLGGTTGEGYGAMRIGGRYGKITGAHVIAVVVDGRAPRPGEQVHHTCENPLCVNPAHLELLTHAEHQAEHRTGCARHGELHMVVWGGRRRCAECNRENVRAIRARKQTAATELPREEAA